MYNTHPIKEKALLRPCLLFVHCHLIKSRIKFLLSMSHVISSRDLFEGETSRGKLYKKSCLIVSAKILNEMSWWKSYTEMLWLLRRLCWFFFNWVFFVMIEGKVCERRVSFCCNTDRHCNLNCSWDSHRDFAAWSIHDQVRNHVLNDRMNAERIAL